MRHPIDRTDWKSGPWDDEPDRVAWVDQATGLDCLIRRGGGGAWCGYVAVEPGHPWHGIDYMGCTQGCEEDWCDHTPAELAQVHGWLTYSSECSGAPDEGICHVPRPGHADTVWWFGFDCNHGGDLAPLHYGRHVDDAYRDQAYVTAETEKLAARLAEAMS